jgi:flagellar basal body-associated protein FliL
LVIAVLFVMQYKKKAAEVSLNDISAPANGHAAPAGDGHGAPAGGGHGGEAKTGEAAADRFHKEPFTVNLKDSRGAHYAKVNVEIEVEDEYVREEIKKLSPRIRDFIVVTLSSKTYEQVESVDGRDFLREEIRNKINGYLTRGQVKNVYFTEFIIQ